MAAVALARQAIDAPSVGIEIENRPVYSVDAELRKGENDSSVL